MSETASTHGTSSIVKRVGAYESTRGRKLVRDTDAREYEPILSESCRSAGQV